MPLHAELIPLENHTRAGVSLPTHLVIHGGAWTHGGRQLVSPAVRTQEGKACLLAGNQDICLAGTLYCIVLLQFTSFSQSITTTLDKGRLT